MHSSDSRYNCRNKVLEKARKRARAKTGLNFFFTWRDEKEKIMPERERIKSKNSGQNFPRLGERH